MSFELSRNIIIGQYIPGNTFVHRLDPRAKILVTLFLLFGISFTRSLIVSFVYLATMLVIVWSARVPLGFVLRPFVRGLPLILFFLGFSVLWLGWQEPAGIVFFQWGWIRITSNALLMAVLSLTRLISLLLLISLPTLTTPITQLTYGMESLLTPLGYVGLPVHDIAMIATISLRFVPILAEEMERVIKAQASRGGEIGALSWREPMQIGKAMLPLVVPLFVNAFRRAEEMAVAMEARCYVSGAGRTRFVQLHAHLIDYVVVVGMLCYVIAVWYGADLAFNAVLARFA
ncbi:MAG: energy-coupling factor transporter transmembrane protein EcfT [Anaerolineales bacterium]|nr:energy-coupling factor transporter transmembrane protein EcfT [Anaerolineales bacterium]